jgi:hypothetical protein
MKLPLRAIAIVFSLLAGPLVAAGAQRGGQRGQAPPPVPRAAAPIDLTGYWVSIIVDEWRFRVTPQKGDIPYLPINARAREIANAWDPAKDEAAGEQCKAYGAIGVMQRPGRLHITWADDTTLKIEADAGTQTRLLRFGTPPTPRDEPSWQGSSVAEWQIPTRRVNLFGDEPPAVGARGGNAVPLGGQVGSLKVVTTKMRPGYIRKNGVPYSENAVLTEYFKVLTGADRDVYLTLTAMVDDPTYLIQPFVRTYTFKKQAEGTGWDPTPCWPR